MNQDLERSIAFIQGSQLGEEEKRALIKSLKDADKALEIAAFKLDRTEKVKRTTGILLEETIIELEEKRKAVECQNRELEIESALERVRTVAMSMNKRDDMLLICRTISAELESLKVREIRNVQTAIIYESKGTYLNFEFYPSHDKTLITEVNYKGHQLQQAFASRLLLGTEEFFSASMQGPELKQWYDYQKTTNQFADPNLETATSLNYYWYSMGPVALGLSTYAPLNEPEVRLFKRFRNVFDLAYRRFLDIEKAEAQAREAQIELALERVRARTMAMHGSGELADVAKLLFKQVKELGITAWTTGFNIWKEDNSAYIDWITDPSGEFLEPYTVTVSSHPVFQDVRKAKESGDDFFVSVLEGPQIKETYELLSSFGTKGQFQKILDAGIPFPTHQVNHFVFGAQVSLLFITYEQYPEAWDVFRRFGKVFEQTYTRFLDLQKAEAQAREAKIEAALEKVRNRTLLMKESSELNEAVAVFFQQFDTLNLLPNEARTYFCHINPDEAVAEVWMTHADGTVMSTSHQTPLNKSSPLSNYFEAWKRKEPILVRSYSGDALTEYLHFLSTLPHVNTDKDYQQILSSPPEKIVMTDANFLQGNIGIMTFEPLTQEALDILVRFAKVFEFTYTRFLDLQKAEAQAKEAKIENGLERVRSRSLAMHNTSELQEVIQTVHKELLNLNIAANGGSFIAINSDISTTLRCWGAGGTADTSEEVRLPVYEKPFCTDLIAGIKKGFGFFTEEFTQKEKKEFFAFLFKHEPWSKLDAKQKKEILSSPGGYTRSCCVSKYTSIFIINHFGEKFSANDNDILKRFAKVFEQTYTRFLDLQKAEGQTRESQIQLALERVRARTMAMQKSDELAETASLMFQQVAALGIQAWSAGFNIWQENDSYFLGYNTGPSGEIGEPLPIPLTEDVFFSTIRDAKKRGEEFLVFESGGESLVETYRYMDTLPIVGEFMRNIVNSGFQLPTYQVTHCGFFPEGHLMFITLEPHPEAWDIFKRFTKVFEQTYTRFLDLQKAEAQAREAKIETAMERTRTQSMIMQRSTELDDTLKVFHEQVLLLGIQSAFSYLWLPDEEKSRHIFWAAWSEELPAGEDTKKASNVFKTKAINYSLDRNEPATKQCLADWKSGESVYSYHVLPDAVENYFAGWQELIDGVDQLKPEYYSAGLYYVEAFMKYGCFGVIVKSDLSEDGQKILARFSIEFERTYTRFLDLKKAEAQAREALIEAALERVRSRSMAMHKSEELRSVVDTLYGELKSLQVNFHVVGIQLLDPSMDLHLWLSTADGLYDDIIHWPFTDIPVFHEMYNARTSGEMLDYTMPEIVTRQFFEEYFKLEGVPKERKAATQHVKVICLAAAYQKLTGVFLMRYTEGSYSPEEKDIIARFSKVFEQTYTRFLDLQKAEAQAKEATIETALERVRSRSMAMHKSDDLHEVIKVVTEQLALLGLKFNVANFAKIDPDGSWSMWLSTPEQTYPALIYVPYLNHPIFNDVTEQVTINTDFYTHVYSREEATSFFLHFFENTIARNTPEERKQFVYSSTGFTRSLFLTKNIWFSVSRYNTTSFTDEENAIFKRFAKVFEQAYTRFLDLQKAEAQAKEAQIEAALERVRSRTMAMQKSEELRAVIQVVYEQFVHLNILIEHTGFIIDYQVNDDMHIWLADQQQIPTRVTIPYFDCAHWNSFNEAKQKGQDFFSNLLDFEEKNRFYLDLFKLVPGVPDEAKNYYLNAPGVAISTVLLENVGLYIENFSAVPYTEEENDILMRFGRVFQQTYTRFLDLQKAEAQAREAQIQLGLERVRARAMAMQNSDELNALIGTVFVELTKLDLQLTRCVIMITNPETNSSRWWMANSEAPETPMSFFVKYHAYPPYLAYLEAWRGRRLRWEYIIDGTIKKEWDDFIFSDTELSLLPDFVIAGMRSPERVYLNASFNNFGNLTLASLEPLSNEHAEILVRFAKVFDLTYTRFNDLKQAEAQAQEAQIQLALERVRARTMAMYKSEELGDISHELFKQIQSLGVETWHCAFNIYDDDQNSSTEWGSNAAGTYPIYKTPREGIFLRYYQVGQTGETLHIEVIGEERCADHYAYLCTLPGVGEQLLKLRDSGVAFPTSQIDHVAYFKYGYLLFITYEPAPGAHEIFKRFAKVFEQTYTRFLDLKQAEAQARESEIQLALERVRARTMAMQNSNELKSAAALLFQQVKSLGVPAYSCGYNIWGKDDMEFTSWMSTQDGSEINGVPNIPLMEDANFLRYVESKQEGEQFFVLELRGERMQEHYEYLKRIPAFKAYFDYALSVGFELPETQIHHLANFTHGNLLFITLDTCPEFHDVFKRFAAVFDQTYTRFLDLQKAEEQAREAQIELGLERVRARAMAMQTSAELSELVDTVFKELTKLDFGISMCIINIIDENNLSNMVWAANPDTGKPPDSYYMKFEDYPFHHAMMKGYKERNTKFIYVIEGDEKKIYDEYLFNETEFSKMPKEAQAASKALKRYVASFSFSNFGGLQTVGEEALAHSHLDILARFGKVFDLTYTRFNDLLKAEAQAREAKIEAALEKARSRTMGMQSSDELPEVANILFLEVQGLGIPAWSCGYNILAEDKMSATCCMSSEGTLQKPFKLRLFGEDSFEKMGDFLRGDQIMLVQELSGEAIDAHYGYMKSFPDLKPTFDQIDELGLSLPTYQINHLCKFTQGFLLFITYEKVPKAHDIFKRFTKVFDQTYTRFLDLKKAEGQALEAIKRASVDRVRAEIASMRTTNDLERITPLIWNELTTLGVPFIRCGVFIMDDEQQQIETYLSTPDGEAIATFNLSYNSPGETAQILAHWHKKELYKQHWNEAQFAEFTQNLVQQGAIKSGEKYLTENLPTDLYLHFLPFLQGMLYAGNTTPLSDDELQLVQNLAGAFSTAYARYEDFNKLEAAKKQVDSTLDELQLTQKQLIQSEKMASLGELTAGIAHEIQNPLNFVNNFSEVSNELLDEMMAEVTKGNYDEVKQIANDVRQNLEKINEHGKRADGIVKGMLQHSRSSIGVKQSTDINKLTDEYLRLAYHGLRAKDKSFNATLNTCYDESIGTINIIPQDIGRVILNLINNAFYAVRPRPLKGSNSYEPTISISTKAVKPPSGGLGATVLITISDNGTGIPQNIVDKIFQPFFTTKPTGQGTGLGLSLAYDIIKAHGGELEVETKQEEGSTFTITLPNV